MRWFASYTIPWCTRVPPGARPRLYWENPRAAMAGLSGGRIELPMAGSVFPHEIFTPPKAWAEAMWPNLFYWNEVDRGGHFAAFEQPKLFTEELRKGFKARRG